MLLSNCAFSTLHVRPLCPAASISRHPRLAAAAAAAGSSRHPAQQRAAAAAAQRPYTSRHPVLVAAAAAKSKSSSGSSAGKGFGPAKQQQTKKLGADGCPCGSGKTYKECCKPHHTGAAANPTVEATVRARFSAMIKKDVSYLLKTTSPFFHSYHYGGEPGASQRQLEDDYHNTVDHYQMDNFKIREVRPGDTPDEATVMFQYTVYDKRTPLIDDQNRPVRKVQIEESKFVRGEDGWQFTEYRLAEVPEALAKTAEMQAQDMAAAAAESSSTGSSNADGASSQTAAASS